MIPFAGIRIQPDWDKAIIEKDSTFWYHRYNADKTSYLKMHIGEKGCQSDVEAISCRFMSSKSICIRDSETRIQSTFQSADLIFSKIHKIQRMPSLNVNSFDVNCSGELAVSAASDDSVCIWETRTGEIRRNLSGHSGEVYSSQFFPSGLVVLTGGSDMQLKIWSVQTGECAATLRPGLGGADNSCTTPNSEPGGHRSAIVDTGFIDRGRNIIAIDRGGWLRLWDVSTQLAISAISLTFDRNGIKYEPRCCAVKEISISSLNPGAAESEINVIETSSTKPRSVGIVDKVVAVGTGLNSLLSLFDLTSSETRKKGPIFKLKLPDNSGEVTACCLISSSSTSPTTNFSSHESVKHPDVCIQSPSITSTHRNINGIFDQYGAVAGSEMGTICCWDLRQPDKPLITCKSDKSSVTSLHVHKWLPHSIYTESGESKSVPMFTGLFVGRRDGRVTLHPLTATTAADDTCVLELTGPDVDAIKGFKLVPSTDKHSTVLTAWSATNSGYFHCYRKLDIASLFN